MSTDRNPREGDEPRPKENAEPGHEAEGTKAEKGVKKPYVFKFRPADPKNDLEFEDMADK